MARRLPDDPTKRRLQIFKRCYQNLQHGIDYLPLRQRQAFERICLKGYTETAARDEMLPNSKSSTPVQQYADSGLVRMVAAYDAKQRGDWPPPQPVVKPKPRRFSFIMSALHPLIKKHLEDARKDIMAQIDGLKVALAQTEELLGIRGNNAPAPTQPAPNPKPQETPEGGKPDLTQMAKELAQAGASA
jgi:hypothetical protein